MRRLVVLLALGGCGDDRRPAADARPIDAAPLPDVAHGCRADVGLADLRLEVVATGLDQPVWVGAPTGDPRLFVAERTGRIRIIRDGALLPTPFLTLAVRNDGVEQGLLGVAFPPDFAADPRVYVSYSDPVTEDQVIAVYAVSGDVANPIERRILAIPSTSDAHNGGTIQFGPDGYMWWSMGEDAQPTMAQDPTSLLGKLLRLDVSTDPYTIPADNPFAAGGGRPEIWALGLRNPWRFSFDRVTGLLYVGDVGQWLREEIDVVDPADGGGLNFGWFIKEGSLCHNPDDFHDDTFGPCAVPGREVLPALELPRGAVVGGHVYRGACMPGLAGTYVYGDYKHSSLRSFRWQDGVATEQTDLLSTITGVPGELVTAVGEDASGELYVTTFSLFGDQGDRGGTIQKIVPR